MHFPRTLPPGQAKKLILAATLLAAALGLSLLGRFTAPKELAPTATATGLSESMPASTSAPGLNFRETGDGLGMLGKPASDVGSMFWRALASIIVIGVLLWVGVKAFKKLMPGISTTRGKNISVQETLFLAPGKAVHLLKVGDRSLLLASSRDALSLLADVTGAVKADESAPAVKEPSA
jgi:flagellar biogenesis protein FliO